MPSRTTDRMQRTIALVQAGKTAYAAGKQADITPQALCMSPLNKQVIAAKGRACIHVRPAYLRKKA